MSITDERLAELEAMLRNIADVLVSRGLDPGAYPETAAALRELQEARILLRALARSGHTARIVSVETTVKP